MSAILSADDLNDFISPGVACIKPVETLPKQVPEEINVYPPLVFPLFPVNGCIIGLRSNNGRQAPKAECSACSDIFDRLSSLLRMRYLCGSCASIASIPLGGAQCTRLATLFRPLYNRQ